MSDENTVTLAGRDFNLTEPDLGVVLRVVNVVGSVGLRAEREAMNLFENPTSTEIILVLMSQMTLDELLKLGAAVLQFKDEAEGITWLRENGASLSGIVKALLVNVRLSADLVESLKGFFGGIRAEAKKIGESLTGDQT